MVHGAEQQPRHHADEGQHAGQQVVEHRLLGRHARLQPHSQHMLQ